MSPSNLHKSMLVRGAVALVAVAVAIAWIPPSDRYTAVGASLCAVGWAGLVIFAKRPQFWRSAIEVGAALFGGWLCDSLAFPRDVRDGNFFLDQVLPNWETGIVFGWLLAAIGLRLFEVDWSKVRPRPIQFNLMQMLGMTSLVAISLNVALRVPPSVIDSAEAEVTVSVAVVCAAAAVGLLVGRARRFAYYATIVMAALSIPLILEAIVY